MSFDGKTVLITGAAGGFGAATAKAFAEAGAKLVLGDILADGLGAGLSGDVVSLVGDVRDPAYSLELVKLALDKFGSLDIAINNAGIVHTPAKIPDLSEAECRKVVDVNLLGVFWALQAQLPVMERNSPKPVKVVQLLTSPLSQVWVAHQGYQSTALQNTESLASPAPPPLNMPAKAFG